MDPVEKLMESGILRSMYDSMPMGVLITDRNCIIRYINNAYLQFAGLPLETRDSIIGMHVLEFRPHSTLPRVMETHEPILNAPRLVNGFKSYCDMLPVFHDTELIGGVILVKDLMTIRELMEQLSESKDKISQLGDIIKKAFKARFTFQDVVSSNDRFGDILGMSHKAAQSDSSVLLLGESGTGKEVLAQSIHNAGRRRQQPFVDINCAAFPENLLESELFGYVGGAFTGANPKGKMGLFELAHGGTIFLDEIAEMPLNLQSKLLRVLQEKRVLRLGGSNYHSVDVRVVAATNIPPGELLKGNKMREDLYFRLAVFIIQIPPLRERHGDVPALAEHFLDVLRGKHNKKFSVTPEAMAILSAYSWPGNIRELKNALEYACYVTDDHVIRAGDLPVNIVTSTSPQNAHALKTLSSVVDEVERTTIAKWLDAYGRSVEAKTRVAAALDISVATLYNKIKKYNLA